MELLLEFLQIADDAILANGFGEIERCIKEMRELVNTHALTEGFTDNHRGDLDGKFDQLENNIINARRILGKINASSVMSPQEKQEQKSKIMVNINMFRRQMYDMMVSMGMNQREMQYHLDRIGQDREYGKPNERFAATNPNIGKSQFKQNFSNAMNNTRNTVPPDQVNQFNKQAEPAGKRRWYQRLFGR